MTGRIRSLRGIALPVAVLALAIVSGLAAMTFAMAIQEYRTARAALAVRQALAAAEAGIATETGAPGNTALGVGVRRVFHGTVGSDGGWYRGEVLRLADSLFFVRAEGFSADSNARQHVGLLARLNDSRSEGGVVRLPQRGWVNLY